MPTSLGSVLTTLIPLGLVVSISPLSLIPAVLVLQTPRPRPTGLAFLGSWVFGLCALTAVFASSSGALDGLRTSPPTWASWLRVALGLGLIAFGVYRWSARGGESESPKWMRAFETMTPRRAALTGLLLVVARLEVLLMCALAGLAIGSSRLARPDQGTATVIFVVVAASSVALPVLAYAGAGHRLDGPMTILKAWMEKNNAALLAVILVLIGAVVFHNGIKAL